MILTVFDASLSGLKISSFKENTMFGFIKKALSKIYQGITSPLKSLFKLHTVDYDTLKKLEQILIEADAGVDLSKRITEKLRSQMQKGALNSGDQLQAALEQELLTILKKPAPWQPSTVFLLVGINGSGKTTAIGKLSHLFNQQNKRILIAAADTFRAAAVQQLAQWAEKTGATFIAGHEGQDPASVVFSACQKFKNEKFDILIIDTAGRLQNKVNLMRELEKIHNVIKKQLPANEISTLLTVDAMLGQNSLDQAVLFHESTILKGIILTKLDGTGKGGIIFSIVDKLTIPIAYISFGENQEALKPFDAHDYISDLLVSE